MHVVFPAPTVRPRVWWLHGLMLHGKRLATFTHKPSYLASQECGNWIDDLEETLRIMDSLREDMDDWR